MFVINWRIYFYTKENILSNYYEQNWLRYTHRSMHWLSAHQWGTSLKSAGRYWCSLILLLGLALLPRWRNSGRWSPLRGRCVALIPLDLSTAVRHVCQLCLTQASTQLNRFTPGSWPVQPPPDRPSSHSPTLSNLSGHRSLDTDARCSVQLPAAQCLKQQVPMNSIERWWLHLHIPIWTNQWISIMWLFCEVIYSV